MYIVQYQKDTTGYSNLDAFSTLQEAKRFLDIRFDAMLDFLKTVENQTTAAEVMMKIKENHRIVSM